MSTPTPEELATTIIGDAAARHLDWFRQRGLIADTIRAAVAAERTEAAEDAEGACLAFLQEKIQDCQRWAAEKRLENEPDERYTFAIECLRSVAGMVRGRRKERK